MRHLFLLLFLATLTSGTFAQNTNSVIGKWKLAKLATQDGTVYEIDNPAAMKKLLARQMKDESGTEPDSVALNLTYELVMPGFEAMTFAFTDNGKMTFTSMDDDGEIKTDITTYTANYKKGEIISKYTEDGEKVEEVLKFKFSGAFLIIITDDGTEKTILTLKKVKK
jgi:hypothetical protein